MREPGYTVTNHSRRVNLRVEEDVREIQGEILAELVNSNIKYSFSGKPATSSTNFASLYTTRQHQF